jgi:hypothetical protein
VTALAAPAMTLSAKLPGLKKQCSDFRRALVYGSA